MDFGDVLKRMMLRSGDRKLRFARDGWTPTVADMLADDWRVVK